MAGESKKKTRTEPRQYDNMNDVYDSIISVLETEEVEDVFEFLLARIKAVHQDG